MDPVPGPPEEKTLGGRWRIRFDRPVGEGTFSRVFACEDLRMAAGEEKPLLRAVNLLKFGAPPELVERIPATARLTAHLDDPAIIRTLDFGTDESGNAWFVSEMCEHPTLERWVQGVRAHDPANALRIGQKVAAALARLRRAYYQRCGPTAIHRDIAPGNVYVVCERLEGGTFGPALDVRIGDWTLARRPGWRVLTQIESGDVIVGTPGFRAPELLRCEPPSIASDIYAIGALIHFADTSLPLADGTAPEELPDSALPREARRYVLRMTDRDPKRRPPTESRVAQDLAALLGEGRVRGGPPLGVAAAAVALAGAALWLAWPKAEVPPPPQAPPPAVEDPRSLIARRQGDLAALRFEAAANEAGELGLARWAASLQAAEGCVREARALWSDGAASPAVRGAWGELAQVRGVMEGRVVGRTSSDVETTVPWEKIDPEPLGAALAPADRIRMVWASRGGLRGAAAAAAEREALPEAEKLVIAALHETKARLAAVEGAVDEVLARPPPPVRAPLLPPLPGDPSPPGGVVTVAPDVVRSGTEEAAAVWSDLARATWWRSAWEPHRLAVSAELEAWEFFASGQDERVIDERADTAAFRRSVTRLCLQRAASSREVVPPGRAGVRYVRVAGVFTARGDGARVWFDLGGERTTPGSKILGGAHVVELLGAGGWAVVRVDGAVVERVAWPGPGERTPRLGLAEATIEVREFRDEAP